AGGAVLRHATTGGRVGGPSDRPRSAAGGGARTAAATDGRAVGEDPFHPDGGDGPTTTAAGQVAGTDGASEDGRAPRGAGRAAPGSGAGAALAAAAGAGVRAAGAGAWGLPRGQPDGRAGGAGGRLRLGVRPRRRPGRRPRLAVRPLVALRPRRPGAG